MSKRVAVVTGGIGGLGTEICKTLARAGRTVIATDLAAREDRIAEFRKNFVVGHSRLSTVCCGPAE